MVKKQQMRWSPRGAHLLLQIPYRVLNNDPVRQARTAENSAVRSA